MLTGDLATAPLVSVLRQLADEAETGCLHVYDPSEVEALVYFKNGLVYAVTVPGRRTQIGNRLISSGALTPEALAEALEVQRTELQGWRLGELLVHLCYIDQPVVEAFIKEQVYDALWDLLRWNEGRWKFRRNERTRDDVAPPMAVNELFDVLLARQEEWKSISLAVYGPRAVPVLSASGGASSETLLDPDAWALLCKVDGERSVAELARDCGFTLFEAAQVVRRLVEAELIDVSADPPAEDEDDHRTMPTGLAAQLAWALRGEPSDLSSDSGDPLGKLADVVSEVAAADRASAGPEVDFPEPAPMPLRPVASGYRTDSFRDSIDRVSAALAEILGPRVQVDPFDLSAVQRVIPARTTVVDPEEQRRERLRAAAAEELQVAHALAEALRHAQEEGAAAEEQRAAAERAAEQEAARLAEERAAEREAARLAEERAEREAAVRTASEEAARLTAEREAAEAAAWDEYAAREAADEQARLAAEREAAEAAAWDEYAAREAADEQARLAAEEQERLAAEMDAARLAAEREHAEREARAAMEAADRMAAASALLTELSFADVTKPAPEEEATVPEDEPLDEDAVVEEPARELEPAMARVEPQRPAEMADTAALLRELASLGTDEEPAQRPKPARPPGPHPPAAAKPKPPKKRGLFGR